MPDLSFAEAVSTVSVRHSLSEVDHRARSARCSVCGPTKVYKNGPGWVCASKSARVSREWRRRHPEKMAASRGSVSPHRLVEKNVSALTGICPSCGPVDIVPFGRGYACGVRARQLRTHQQQAPAARCTSCGVWSSADNRVRDDVCERCADLVPGRTLIGWSTARPANADTVREAALVAEFEGAGMHVSYPPDPYEVDDFEPVPGWRTLGS